MKIKDKFNFKRIIEHLRNLEVDPGHHENQRFSGHRKSPIFSCFGKPLTGNLKGLWSYRTGDFRIIYQIQKENDIVFITTIGHRRGIYD